MMTADDTVGPCAVGASAGLIALTTLRDLKHVHQWIEETRYRVIALCRGHVESASGRIEVAAAQSLRWTDDVQRRSSEPEHRFCIDHFDRFHCVVGFSASMNRFQGGRIVEQDRRVRSRCDGASDVHW